MLAKKSSALSGAAVGGAAAAAAGAGGGAWKSRDAADMKGEIPAGAAEMEVGGAEL